MLGLDRPLIDQRDWMREFLPTQLAILESRELATMAREQVENRQSCQRSQRWALISAEEIVGGRWVSPLNNTRLVSIGFRSTDPVIAAEVANALARAYVKWNTVSKSTTTGEASDWLKKQVEEQRRFVQSSEAAVQRYKRENEAEALGERQNLVVQKLADIQAQTTRAATETDRQRDTISAAFEITGSRRRTRHPACHRIQSIYPGQQGAARGYAAAVGTGV